MTTDSLYLQENVRTKLAIAKEIWHVSAVIALSDNTKWMKENIFFIHCAPWQAVCFLYSTTGHIDETGAL